MQDRHEVVLEANITGFKQKMKEASSEAKRTSKLMQEYMKFGYSKSIWDKPLGIDMIESNNNIKNLSANFSKLNSSMVLTKASLGSTSSGLEKISNESKKVEINTNGMEKAWTKGLKSVKKLTIGFLGARTAFGLFRKYMSEYSRENEEFANKMQITTSIVANTLAPVFEWFANILQYAAIGLARIIELLTGVNILGKATDNAFKGAAKSAKEFNDNLSGLDEISNISESQGGLSTGIGAQLNALNEFQSKIKEVDEWLERTKIKKFFEDLKPVLRDVFGWMVEHPLGTLGIIGGLKTLEIMLPGIMLGTAGAGTGLTGLLATLSQLAILGVVTVGVVWVDSEVNKSNENLVNFTNTIDGFVDDYDEMTERLKEQIDLNPTKQNFDALKQVLFSKKTAIQTEIDGLKRSLTWYQFIFEPALYIDAKDQIKDLNKELIEVEQEIADAEKEASKYTADATEQTKEYNKAINEANEETNDLSKNVSNLGNKKAYPEVNLTGNAKSELNSVWNLIQKIGGSSIHISASGELHGGGGRSHANGGIFAGHWMPISAYAGGGLADEGQMFVAREAGPELVGTISGHTAVMNNDQIVASVSAGVYSAVLSAMGGQSDRPIVLNVNGREFAQATYDDFQNEGLRRGTNTALRRY